MRINQVTVLSYYVVLSTAWCLPISSVSRTPPRQKELRKLIVDQCGLDAQIRPVLSFNESVMIAISMDAVSFQGIDDNQGTFSVVADLVVQWQNNCSVWNDLDEWRDVEYFTLGIADTWTPMLQHLNTIEHLFIQSIEKDSVALFYNEGLVEWLLNARFASNCQLVFDKFPFDQQTCSIDLEPELSMQHSTLVFDSPSAPIHINASAFTRDNDIWEFKQADAHIAFVVYPYYEESTYSRAIFTFTFQRRYQIYVTSILLPTFSLALLQIASGFLPPEETDRANFCISVVLAYSVVQSTVDGLLPKSQNIPYFTRLLAFQLITGVMCSLYAVVTCSLGRQNRYKAVVRLTKNGPALTLIRLIDIAFYGVITFLTVVIDATIFVLMLN